jgi:hypothetical protein
MSFEIPAGGRGGKRHGGSLENTIEEESGAGSIKKIIKILIKFGRKV